MLKNIEKFEKDLRRAEKCSNFATAIGKRTASGPEGRADRPMQEIENNDMMPQDKQRRPKRSDAAETREHEV